MKINFITETRDESNSFNIQKFAPQIEYKILETCKRCKQHLYMLFVNVYKNKDYKAAYHAYNIALAQEHEYNSFTLPNFYLNNKTTRSI